MHHLPHHPYHCHQQQLSVCIELNPLALTDEGRKIEPPKRSSLRERWRELSLALPGRTQGRAFRSVQDAGFKLRLPEACMVVSTSRGRPLLSSKIVPHHRLQTCQTESVLGVQGGLGLLMTAAKRRTLNPDPTRVLRPCNVLLNAAHVALLQLAIATAA